MGIVSEMLRISAGQSICNINCVSQLSYADRSKCGRTRMLCKHLDNDRKFAKDVKLGLLNQFFGRNPSVGRFSIWDLPAAFEKVVSVPDECVGFGYGPT